ncbi:hypothetical protein AXE80_03545 [Wenyingzhuangia fucanilytica]|uniref:FAS1 domain-containing protein n=2 Tax=Wenyingzhuangia fucanilytica TaxID=1790137 RepID=A0A1B1Y3T8_9FLAO|nr:hypothetical protein AXE80_03545 [Wenyingzhuangia fucanilytica]
MVVIAVSSCNSWDDHYEQLDTRLESDIITVLSEDSNYSTFLSLLQQTDYKDFLKTSQAYTVWAPNNAALAQVSDDILNDPDMLKQLVENHISRNSYNSSNLDTPLFVKMFNNKYIEFTNAGGSTSFGGVELIEKDVLTANGILHKIGTTLTVRPNIWAYLNENSDDFLSLMEYFNQFNETVFDEPNSVRVGRNSLGQIVYDSVFKTSNKRFDSIGDLSSEEERFTFIGLTDAVYTDVFNSLKGYFQYPVEDSIKSVTDKVIFNNLNFPVIDSDELDGTELLTTTDNLVTINKASIAEEHELSNGNLFVMNQYDLAPKNVAYKPVRYEIENIERREIGSLVDLTISSRFNSLASGGFTNVVDLLNSPDGNDGNNYFEVAFENVLSASYTINLKFTPVGAPQQTKLKFEFSYVDENKNTVVDEIDAITVSHLEDGIISIGGTYDIPVYINEENDNEYSVKLKVIVDVSDAETILYSRRFGIDYAELVPVD